MSPTTYIAVSVDTMMKEDESVKSSKRKAKKEDAWRSEAPKDPVAMVGVFLCWIHIVFQPQTAAI